MPNNENMIPVFIQVQERHDRINAQNPGDSLKQQHDRRRAQVLSAIREIINPPKLEPIEIPIEPEMPIDRTF